MRVFRKLWIAFQIFYRRDRRARYSWRGQTDVNKNAINGSVAGHHWQIGGELPQTLLRIDVGCDRDPPHLSTSIVYILRLIVTAGGSYSALQNDRPLFKKIG